MKELLPQIAAETDLDSLRGLEGAQATAYFRIFDQLILGEKPLLSFQNRSRRPPLDPVNALLSFAYSCSLTTAPPPWRVLVWTPMWAFFTGIAPDGSHWRWISWRSSAPAWRTALPDADQ